MGAYHNLVHHPTGTSPPPPRSPQLPAQSHSLLATLCTCTVGGARAPLAVHLLSGEQEKPAHERE